MRKSHYSACQTKLLLLLSLLFPCTTLTAGNHEKATKPLASEEQQVGYSYGQMFGRRLSSTMSDIDIDAFIAGFQDGYSGKDSQLSEEQMNKALQTHQAQLRDQQMAEHSAKAAENLKKSEDFLTQNASKDGIKTTASGLQYKIITEGEGTSPAPEDTVEVHYTGTLINGNVFDSSVQRGTPASFPVKGVIPGWTEALQLMKPGGKWQLFIPPDLAYGANGTGRIGPNEALIFEVELLSVK